jgi:hypothetical protein
MKRRLLATACLALSATTACSGSMSGRAAASAPPGMQHMVTTDRSDGRPAGRLVTQFAGLSLVTDSLARVHRTADSLAVAWGGYVSGATLREGELQMSLRVPADSLNPVLDRLATLGRARNRTVSRNDVTDQVVDVEARLANLRAVRDRLRAYLQQAGQMSDVVTLERELTRVQGEIDVLEARQRQMAGQVALAEVSLDAERPRVLGPLGWLVVGLGTLIEKLFVIR